MLAFDAATVKQKFEYFVPKSIIPKEEKGKETPKPVPQTIPFKILGQDIKIEALAVDGTRNFRVTVSFLEKAPVYLEEVRLMAPQSAGSTIRVPDKNKYEAKTKLEYLIENVPKKSDDVVGYTFFFVASLKSDN